MVGQGICIQNATFCYAKIVAVASATSLTLSNPPSATATGTLRYAIGGAWADPQPFLNCNTFANTTCGVRSGDSLYIGAGVYRVVEAVGSNFGSQWKRHRNAMIQRNAYFNGVVNVVGDVTGQYTGDAGMVQLTAYTTNDKTAPSATTLLNLNGKSNLAFSNIMFVGGNAIDRHSYDATSQNITFHAIVRFSRIRHNRRRSSRRVANQRYSQLAIRSLLFLVQATVDDLNCSFSSRSRSRLTRRQRAIYDAELRSEQPVLRPRRCIGHHVPSASLRRRCTHRNCMSNGGNFLTASRTPLNHFPLLLSTTALSTAPQRSLDAQPPGRSSKLQPHLSHHPPHERQHRAGSHLATAPTLPCSTSGRNASGADCFDLSASRWRAARCSGSAATGRRPSTT